MGVAGKSKPTFRPTLDFEIKAGHPHKTIVGVDEVGRGCIAGPVVAAAVVLPTVVDWELHPWLKEVGDSKLLTPKKREELCPQIKTWARASAIGIATVAEIDEINIFHAAHLAMVRAVNGLPQELRTDCILIDGKFSPKGLSARVVTIIKGDQKSLSIACASIVAKVWRDTHLVELDAKFPGYGLAVHKGYGTPKHQAAIKELGVKEIHRRSFAPVAQALHSQKI